MKITIYELLGLIKDGKAPKKVKYKNHIYKYQYKDNRESNIINYYHSETVHHHLIDGGYHDIRLNDEVEIIEEKCITLLNKDKFYNNRFPDSWEEEMISKIDEIVKAVNKLILKDKSE